MESYYKLTEVKKEKNPNFLFYLNLLNDEKKKNFINNIFNLPKLPLIGIKKENNNNSHLLGKLLSLISFQINICQGEKKDEIDQLFSDFKLPNNLNEYLNIEEVIEIDNNTEDQDMNLYFMPKRKLNFYFIISELPLYTNKNNKQKYKSDKKDFKNNYNNYINNDYDDNEMIDFFADNNKSNSINNKKNDKDKNKENKINKIHDEQDKNNENKKNIIQEDKDNPNKINLIKDDKNNENKINIINEEEENINIINKFDDYEDIKDYNYDDFEKNDYNNYDNYEVYNIIPHFFYINDNEKNLLEVKNLFFDKQITLFALPNKSYHDIERENDKNYIDINNLRAESSNIVLINNNNFVLEPDNLKFYLDVNKSLSQFYLIYTSDEDDHHSVFYYITCNNIEAKNKMINLLNKADTLKDLINEIAINFGNNQVFYNLKKIFLNKE